MKYIFSVITDEIVDIIKIIKKNQEILCSDSIGNMTYNYLLTGLAMEIFCH
jgi:hypothetical protein